MSFPERHGHGQFSFLGRLAQSFLVGMRLFLFCTVTLTGIWALAGGAFFAVDPEHSATSAAQRAVRFVRVPFGVTIGLCIFFAAVSWTSPAGQAGTLARTAHHRPSLVLQRRTTAGKREVS